MKASAACLLVALLCAAGCGASGARRRPGREARAVRQAQASHEYRSRPPPPQRAFAGTSSAAAAVTAFVTAYINWSAQSVSGDMRTLAAETIGQARSAMQLAAAQTASDYELQHGGIANRGTVEAVAPLRGGSDQYIVVTRELTSATATTAYEGLEPAWHVAVVTVSRQSGAEWVVSDWQPES